MSRQIKQRPAAGAFLHVEPSFWYRVISQHPRLGVVYLAQFTGIYKLFRRERRSLIAEIERHRQRLAGFFRRSNHFRRLLRVGREGLFAQHVLARFQSCYRRRHVQEIGEADAYGFQFVIAGNFVL